MECVVRVATFRVRTLDSDSRRWFDSHKVEGFVAKRGSEQTRDPLELEALVTPLVIRPLVIKKKKKKKSSTATAGGGAV